MLPEIVIRRCRSFAMTFDQGGQIVAAWQAEISGQHGVGSHDFIPNIRIGCGWF
jgi:hypothetical protein